MIGKTIGRYKIICKIGEGGMAIVYKAEDLKLERIVALKILRQQFTFDEEFVNRFISEAKASAKLQHHNIVHVYDASTEDNTYFIAMEYLEGETLYKMLKNSNQPLSPKISLNICKQVSQALDYAHTKHNLIHRDVKPSNIMLCSDGRVVLMDFGIAKAKISSKFTQTGIIIGTPEYMSPESAEGKEIDHRSDIYSLGIVLYECLTGFVPFKADTPIATAVKHINSPLPNLKTINPQLPEWIVNLTSKMLEKNPEHRIQTANTIVIIIEKEKIDETFIPSISKPKEKEREIYKPYPPSRPRITAKPSIPFLWIIVPVIFITGLIILLLSYYMMKTSSISQSSHSSPSKTITHIHPISSNKTPTDINTLIRLNKPKEACTQIKITAEKDLNKIEEEFISFAQNHPEYEICNSAVQLISYQFAKRGDEFYERRQLDKAADYYEKSISINPKYTEVMKDLGAIYYKQGKFPEAKEQFENLLRIDPNNKDRDTIEAHINKIERMEGGD